MEARVPKFSVLMVNFNGGGFLQDAIDSLARQTYRNFEVILIDNNSDDGSIRDLNTADLPAFTLVAEAENHGFAKANNMAARLACGEWLALLNPDTVADQNWLLHIDEEISQHEAVNVFACAQMSMDDSHLMDGAGDAYLLFGIPWRGGFERPVEELPEKGTCFSPCGASAVYRRQVFLEYDGFDERFFCYCEDVDLGYRMQMGGELCIFLPRAVVHHKGSGTSGRRSYFTMYHGNRNRTWTYLKNTPLLLLILTLPGHLVLISYIYFRNRGLLENGGMRKGIVDGFRDGWQLRRQSEYRVHRRVGLWSLMRAMAWNPFRMSQRKAHVRPLLPK